MSQAVDLDALKAEIRRMSRDFVYFARKALKIVPKEGGLVPLKLNTAQKHLHRLLEGQLKKEGRVRAVILKGRQQGCSTYIEARFFWKVIFNRGIRAYILTHRDEATQNLFNMAKRFYENLPKWMQPELGASNPKEMIFSVLDSGYNVATAGGKDIGRGGTIQLFHASECAYWKNAADHIAGAMQAVPDLPGTEVIMESTGHGKGNEFYKRWELAVSGRSGWLAIFVPWWWQKEYRAPKKKGEDPGWDEQELKYLEMGVPEEALLWRRKKIMDDFAGDVHRFMQEYPTTPEEAFIEVGYDPLIPRELVERAMQNEDVEPYGPVVIGVDPARGGEAYSAVAIRRGDYVEKVERYKTTDLMELVGLIGKLIHKHQPVKVFLDIGGMGGGVYDRLKELGYGGLVIGVNFASTANDPERYVNKRAEMWGEMADWLRDERVRLPKDDALARDLCAPQRIYDSKGRLKLESKQDMRKRGIPSPDLGDALALTFAMPVGPYIGIRLRNPWQELEEAYRRVTVPTGWRTE